MWRVQRLDQINPFKPANPFDFKSLTLKFRSEQIGRFKTTIRPEQPLLDTSAFIKTISNGVAIQVQQAHHLFFC
jgi:hypothetical protein